MFELGLDENEIIYKRIGIATPRHNGKVERQPRIDARRFYKTCVCSNLEDSRWQPAKYNQKSNGAVICLGFKRPDEVLEDYLCVMF